MILGIPQNSIAYRNTTLVAFGVFLWDYCITLWVEIFFVSGRLKLRWPLIPYLITRYTTLAFVILCIVFQTPPGPLKCDALYLGGDLLGKVAVAFASVNILVRTVIIWSYRWYIVLLLGLLVSGEAILICVGLGKRSITATWDGDLQCCTLSIGSERTDLGFFAPYALCVDCISVGLTVIGLRRFDPKSSFATVLFRQGLSFFLLVLPFQTFVTVAVYTTGNEIFVSTSSVLCGVVVPMVSCYMVRSILGGSRSTSGLCNSSHANPTTDPGIFRRDGIQLDTHVELGSSTLN